MTSDTCGPTSPEPCAYYDPVSSSWRTLPRTCDAGFTPFLGTLPRSGTTRRGRLYELVTSAPPTGETEFSCSPSTPTDLLPTPAAVAYGNNRGGSAGRVGKVRPSLEGVVQLLPTPHANMSIGAGTSGRDGGLNLQTAVTLFPSPRASDAEKGWPNMRGSSGDPMLPTVVNRLLPTPTVRDSKGHNQRADQTCLPGVILPWTGESSSPPSAAGKAS